MMGQMIVRQYRSWREPMPLHILASLVVIGLALVIGAAWLQDRSRTPIQLDEKGFRDRFLRDFPNEVIDTVLVSSNNRNAIIELEDRSRLGLIFAMGQNHATRLLEAGMVQKVVADEGGIHLELSDFSLHSADLDYPEELERNTLLSWFNRLESI